MVWRVSWEESQSWNLHQQCLQFGQMLLLAHHRVVAAWTEAAWDEEPCQIVARDLHFLLQGPNAVIANLPPDIPVRFDSGQSFNI